ncbi:hypothetical protein ASALC70_04083 [Alcanivorax sp. ALC70]|nr:hypothetical protein ASALC70_04083 [Alcanivorax sp. ALC70]
MNFVIFSICIFFLTALIAVNFVKFRSQAFFLDPIVPFGTVYVISYFLMPAYAFYYGYSRYGLMYAPSSYYYAVIYAFVFFVMLNVAYLVISHSLFSPRHSLAGRARAIAEMRSMGNFLVVGILFFLLSAFSFFEFYKIVSAYGLNTFLANRIVLTSGLGYLKLLLFFPVMWANVFVLEYYFVRYSKFSWLRYFKGLLLVLLASVPLLVLGSRSNLLMGVILYSFSIIILYLKRTQLSSYRRIVNKFAIAGLMLVFLGGALGQVRQNLMVTSEQGLPQEIKKEIPAESVVSAFSSYENLTWFFSQSDEYSYEYGGTYFSVLVGPVPRALWSEKPTGGGRL